VEKKLLLGKWEREGSCGYFSVEKDNCFVFYGWQHVNNKITLIDKFHTIEHKFPANTEAWESVSELF